MPEATAVRGGGMMPTATMSLAEAKEWLRARVNRGDRCPCCGQFAKVYSRKMTAFTARAMIAMYRYYRTEFVQMPELIRQRLTSQTQGGYATLGLYWGLIEEENQRREDGGRAGWWRLTELGIQFVLGEISVPKHARIYDGRILGYSDERVTIRDTLGTKFNYDELMSL